MTKTLISKAQTEAIRTVPIDPHRSIYSKAQSAAPGVLCDQGPLQWKPPSAERLCVLLPEYEICQLVGLGGMGAIYRGRQSKLDRDVAVKILPESLNSQTTGEIFPFTAGFEKEAQIMASLDHPAIVPIHDFGETTDGHLYIVMDFVDGMNIHQYLMNHGGRLEQTEALNITAHVLDALHYIHHQGVTHRDIKPANILLDFQGRVKIVDFGLAQSGPPDPAITPTLDQWLLGTPVFTAPEVFASNNIVDQRIDIYSVGVMMYQMLTGSYPTLNYIAPSVLCPGLDPLLDEITAKAMSPTADHRYDSAAGLRFALEPVLFPVGAEASTCHPQTPVMPRPGPLPKPASRMDSSWLLPVFGAFLLFALAIGFFGGQWFAGVHFTAHSKEGPLSTPRILPEVEMTTISKPARSVILVSANP